MVDDLKDMKLLPLEGLMKALDEKGIEYNRDIISNAYFPLDSKSND